jgi:microcompartment protein CcmL/EutN
MTPAPFAIVAGAAGPLALVEIDAVATGLATVDAMVKRARVEVRAGVVEPGRYLVLFRGELGDVEEAMDAALRRAESSLVDRVLLARPDVRVLPAIEGARTIGEPDCVGVVEGRTVAGTIEACDRAIKDAAVGLAGLRIAPGMGGRAYFAVTGAHHDVEAAVEAGSRVLGGRLHRCEVIPRATAALVESLLAPGVFGGGR